MDYQAIWDSLHDALMFPRSKVVTRGWLPECFMGSKAPVGIYQHQLTVTFQTHQELDAAEELARTLAVGTYLQEYAPRDFGALPQPYGVLSKALLRSPDSPLIVRVVEADSGPVPYEGTPEHTKLCRLDVLFSEGA